MSGQSWKQTVETLAGPEPSLTLAYQFSGSGTNNDDKQLVDNKKKKIPDGVFVERKLHGVFTG